MLDDEERCEDYQTCPKCKSVTTMYPECPTYNRNGIIYRCTPSCGNAYTYSCTSWECDWSYTDGLNPMNPRNEQNLRNKPEWLIA